MSLPGLIINNAELLPEEFRTSFQALAEKIADLAEVHILELLSGGFSNAAPLLVYASYKHSATHQVFKIGEKDIIEKEAYNWKRFIENGHFGNQHIVHMKGGLIAGSPHSLIVYNLAGSPSNKPSTFKELYRDTFTPHHTLKVLFQDILRPSPGKCNSKPISDVLQISDRDKIADAVWRLTGDSSIRQVPKIMVNGSELLNPLCFYPFNGGIEPEKKAVMFPAGLVHGDLNAGNILFYDTVCIVETGGTADTRKAKIPCLIDYAWTGVESLYTDIAKLESVLKFQLCRIDRVDQDQLFTFESANVLGNLMPSDTPPISDAALQKLFLCLKVLRTIVSEIIAQCSHDPVPYWLTLYKNALAHLRYEDISESQKRYAFLSAALILTRHLAQ